MRELVRVGSSLFVRAPLIRWTVCFFCGALRRAIAEEASRFASQSR